MSLARVAARCRRRVQCAEHGRCLLARDLMRASRNLGVCLMARVPSHVSVRLTLRHLLRHAPATHLVTYPRGIALRTDVVKRGSPARESRAGRALLGGVHAQPSALGMASAGNKSEGACASKVGPAQRASTRDGMSQRVLLCCR